MKTIDINADLGESFGDWRIGDDRQMLKLISSANIACGYHAGDPDVMRHTIEQASPYEVSIGAHPGFPDLQGFGRRRMDIAPKTLANMIIYQIGAAKAFAEVLGVRLRHVKLHGALANMAAEDFAIASACFEAALEVDDKLILFVIARSAQERAARFLGANMALEVFADRSYEDDGTLTPRDQHGAVLSDPSAIAERVLDILAEGRIISRNGERIETNTDSICVHGDTAGSVRITRVLRDRLIEGGYAIRPVHNL